MDGKVKNDADGSSGERFGGDEERTVVIAGRVTRDGIIRGVRNLAAGFGQLRGGLYQAADFLDAGSASGLETLTHHEAEDLQAHLEDISTRVTGVLVALKRATGPEPKDQPGQP